MEDWQARLVVRHLGDPNERAVAWLLLDAELELVTIHAPVLQDTGGEGEGGGSRIVGEIDLLFRHGETAFIVEVSFQRERGEKLRRFFDVFSRKETLDSIMQNEDYLMYMKGVTRFKRVYFDMRHSHSEKELGDIVASIAGEGNHIVLRDEFDRIQAWMRKKSADRFLEVALTRSGNGAIQVPSDG